MLVYVLICAPTGLISCLELPAIPLLLQHSSRPSGLLSREDDWNKWEVSFSERIPPLIDALLAKDSLNRIFITS